jgi:chromosome segregation ATPase
MMGREYEASGAECVDCTRLRAALEHAERALGEVTKKFQDQRRLLNEYESAAGFNERVEARAAAYHDEACVYATRLAEAAEENKRLRVRVGDRILFAEQAQARLAEMEKERDTLQVRIDRADGALADAATVQTGDLERGIRQLANERDGLDSAYRENLTLRTRLAEAEGMKGAVAGACEALRAGAPAGREETR